MTIINFPRLPSKEFILHTIGCDQRFRIQGVQYGARVLYKAVPLEFIDRLTHQPVVVEEAENEKFNEEFLAREEMLLLFASISDCECWVRSMAEIANHAENCRAAGLCHEFNELEDAAKDAAERAVVSVRYIAA